MGTFLFMSREIDADKRDVKSSAAFPVALHLLQLEVGQGLATAHGIQWLHRTLDRSFRKQGVAVSRSLSFPSLWGSSFADARSS